MAEGLDVFIVDDDSNVCEIVTDIVNIFYSWGEVHAFTDVDVATEFCLNREVGVGIFIVDVFLGGKSGFYFLDSIGGKFPTAHEDAVIITGNASDDIVNMCVAANVNHLLEKPIRAFALQMAVRSVVSKYLRFSKKLLQDPIFAEIVSKVDQG
jgi:response regulator of citrate/malate metabolism